MIRKKQGGSIKDILSKCSPKIKPSTSTNNTPLDDFIAAKTGGQPYILEATLLDGVISAIRDDLPFILKLASKGSKIYYIRLSFEGPVVTDKRFEVLYDGFYNPDCVTHFTRDHIDLLKVDRIKGNLKHINNVLQAFVNIYRHNPDDLSEVGLYINDYPRPYIQDVYHGGLGLLIEFGKKDTKIKFSEGEYKKYGPLLLPPSAIKHS